MTTEKPMGTMIKKSPEEVDKIISICKLLKKQGIEIDCLNRDKIGTDLDIVWLSLVVYSLDFFLDIVEHFQENPQYYNH